MKLFIYEYININIFSMENNYTSLKIIWQEEKRSELFCKPL